MVSRIWCRETAALQEIASWDGFRPATLAAAEFPVDVVRLSVRARRRRPRARRAEKPEGSPAAAARAQEAFDRAGRKPASLALARGGSLDLGGAPAVMGILNVTPDSFSDGGLHFGAARAVERALAMFGEGAAIVDVGGESTRPASYGAAPEVPAAEEIERVVPVIEAIRSKTALPLSIDTRKAAVARAAIAAGADLVNDVSAFRFDPDMAGVVAETGAAAILMHMKGSDPRTMQADVSYAHPLAEIAAELAAALTRGLAAGVAADRLAIDPGLGFGKSPAGNLVLLRYLAAFRTPGFPVAAGASRKAFVRLFSGVGDEASNAERLPGSLACVAASARAGAALLRVHDVAETVRFLRMRRAIETPAARVPAVSEAAAR
jgi:dihydropteroate synthase